MINKEDKYNALRVRMSPLELEFLDAFCEINKQSRSKIVKNALKSYLYRNIDNKKRPNKKVIFSQNMLKPLLDNADKKLIKQIAEISFQNGVSDHRYLDNMLDTLKKGSIPTDYTLDLEGRIKSLIENVFAPDAQNWFDSIRYGWNKKIMVIGGKHNLGRNFSRFIKYLMIKYMKIYSYELISKEFRECRSEYNDKLIYVIILHFGPSSFRS
ncbi:MAG: hypothetical protein ACFFA6_11280 [Promethearchaeota archaeon]